MRQVVLTAPKQIEFREVAAPEAGNLKSDEVLLRILRIGICGSEIHSYHGQHPATFYPVVQGHEYSAEVVAVGSAVRKVKPGDRVTGRPQLVCGECNPCKRGQYNVCSNLRVEAFQADGVVDLAVMARARGIQAQGLRTLAANLLGFRISKSAQCSNWENHELTLQQIKYAATDAWVGRELYFHMLRMGVQAQKNRRQNQA